MFTVSSEFINHIHRFVFRWYTLPEMQKTSVSLIIISTECFHRSDTLEHSVISLSYLFRAKVFQELHVILSVSYACKSISHFYEQYVTAVLDKGFHAFTGFLHFSLTFSERRSLLGGCPLDPTLPNACEPKWTSSKTRSTYISHFIAGGQAVTTVNATSGCHMIKKVSK